MSCFKVCQPQDQHSDDTERLTAVPPIGKPAGKAPNLERDAAIAAETT